MSTSAGIEAPVGAPSGRPPTRRRGIAWVLVAAGAVIAALMIASGATSLVSLATRHHATGSAELAGVSSVVVNADNCGGDVRVTGEGAPSSTGSAGLRWRDTWGRHRPHHTQSVDGSGVLNVTVSCERLSFGASPSSDLRLTVPAGAPVSVSAGAGDITTTGLMHLQRLRTGAGDVTVTGTGSGPVRLSTGSGDVQLRRSRATDVTASSGSGDVLVEMTEAPWNVMASSGSGDIVLRIPDIGDGYDVTAHTGSGDTHVGFNDDPGSDRHLSLRSGSGDLTATPTP